jgi:amidohydrolase
VKLHPIIERMYDDCIRIRRDLHRIPETGFDLFKTSGYVRDELLKYSPDAIDTFAKTGLRAVFYAKNADTTIALRADMDALLTEELCETDYVSAHKGVMHGCGHDGHMTMLLLAARLISENRGLLKSNVSLIFQPGEEGFGGAKVMINEGVLKNPDADRIYGMHLWPDVPKGKIGIRWGTMMSRACEFDITAKGVSAHGAYPQYGIDAIVASAMLISLLQTAITRNVDPHQDVLLTIGKISGGIARNIIADNVVMNATLRTMSDCVYSELMERIISMANGMQMATGAEFSINELISYPCLVNPRHMVEDFYSYMDTDDVVLVEPVMAAEDFSFYQKEVPGIFMFLGAKGGKNTVPLHNSRFDFDEDAMLYGVEIYRRLLGIGD